VYDFSDKQFMDVKTHEQSHVGDINFLLDPARLNQDLQTEGFATFDQCDLARENVRAALVLMKGAVESATHKSRDD
jgi:hypothetical protein